MNWIILQRYCLIIMWSSPTWACAISHPGCDGGVSSHQWGFVVWAHTLSRKYCELTLSLQYFKKVGMVVSQCHTVVSRNDCLGVSSHKWETKQKFSKSDTGRSKLTIMKQWWWCNAWWDQGKLLVLVMRDADALAEMMITPMTCWMLRMTVNT